MKGKQTSWGAVADWYDELLEDSSDSYQKNVILPNLERLVEPKSGLKILDVACGQGFFSRAFAAKGATVEAADIAKELIEKAQAMRGEISYHVVPSDKLSFAGDASVDVVTIVLALQNIERLTETIAECARVLKPRGRLYIVLNHPAFRIPQASSWQWDEAAERQYRRVDSYMSEKALKIDMTPGEKNSAQKKFTISFHRPLQVYMKALAKQGFALTRLEEWISHKKSEKGPRAREEDRSRKEIPLFLCLESTTLKTL